MNDDDAIAIADVHMAGRGYPTSPVRAGVVRRPAKRVVEVAFAASDEFKERRGFDASYRIFLEESGFYLGALLADGTTAQFDSIGQRTRDEELADTAARCLQAVLRLPRKTLDHLVPTIIDPTDLFEVYYQAAEDHVFGGDYTVYMLDPGLVIRVLRGQ